MALVKNKGVGKKAPGPIKESGKAKDISGETFGHLTAVHRVENPDDRSRPYWQCVCDCGGINAARIVRADNLSSGRTKQCVDCAAVGRNVGRPVGAQNKPTVPRYVVKTYIGQSRVAGSRPTCSVVYPFNNPLEPIHLIQPAQRKDGIKGYPPGTTGILNSLAEMGVITERGAGLLNPWVRKNGVVFETEYVTDADAVEAQYREWLHILPIGPEPGDENETEA